MAGDPATRALAASAGLPVFASVAEYEASLGRARGRRAAAATAGPSRRRRPPAARLPRSRGARAEAAGEPADAGAPEPARGGRSRRRPRLAVGRGSDAAGWPSRAAARRSVPPVDVEPAAARPARRPPPASGEPRPAAARGGCRRPLAAVAAGSGRPGSSAPRSSALALLVGGVGAYLLLPSATIVVTPRPEPVGPIQLTVVADPTATAPDPAAGVVPAKVVSIPVAVDDTFAATGKRVELTKATGTVRFENLDPTSTNRIAAGQHRPDGVRRSASGRMRTITVPRAELVGLTIFPARASVKVTAVDGGPDGNVEPGTIDDRPARRERRCSSRSPTRSRRPAARSEEFTRVTQAGRRRRAGRPQRVAPGGVHARRWPIRPSPPAARRSSRRPASLGEPTPTVATRRRSSARRSRRSPSGLSATGHGRRGRLRAGRGDRRDRSSRPPSRPATSSSPGSVQVDVGDAGHRRPDGQLPGHGDRPSRSRSSIPAELEAMVLGKPIDEAQAILAPFGDGRDHASRRTGPARSRASRAGST